MTDTGVFRFHEGRLPLLVSVPHDGQTLPTDIGAQMTARARELPDNDWHVATLYDFVPELGASMLTASYSRYVVDLNRPATDEALYADQLSTGLCPRQSFSGDPLYKGDAAIDIRDRVERYWRPYHEKIRDTLVRMRERHGYALLWDAHSIASVVPRLFDGTLPALNLGTNDGASCPAAVTRAVFAVAKQSGLSAVLNDRFRGGYITRHFGAPSDGLFAFQLEIAQRCYMDESTLRYDRERAEPLRETLRDMLSAYVAAAEAHCGDRR